MGARAERVWPSRLLAICLGLGGVVALELLLRLWPGLGPEPLVVELAAHDGRVLRSINARYAERFFSERYQGQLIASGRMAAEPFVEPRPANALRVVFVGASTVQGYPLARRLAAASFLEAMLQDALPGRQVQVFNLGITSIASFAVGRVLEDAMALEPDLAVVYAGHNEFYGLYGVGERPTPRFNRFHYGLLEWRLAMLARRLLDALRGREVTTVDLLEIMGERGVVPQGSPRRQAALVHLRENYREMARLCRQRQVPLVLCTLAANDAGFAPVGAAEPVLGGLQKGRWEKEIARAEKLLSGHEVSPDSAAMALAGLDRVGAGASENAWWWYLRGRALGSAGRAPEAFAAFRRARELDTMPWRAPEGHNRVIREVASEAGVLLADVEGAFRHHAPPAGVGWELMADHVHPSVRGQYLLARTVVEALGQWQLAAGAEWARLRNENEYRRLLGELPVEQVKVDQAMAKLLAAKPMDRFNGQNAHRFARRAAAGWQALSEPERAGARKWNERQDEVPLALEVADQLVAARDFVGARQHYAAARLEAPFTPRGDLWAAVQWAWCARLGGQELTPAAQGKLRAVLGRVGFVALAPQIDPVFVSFIRGRLRHFLGERSAALSHLGKAFETGQFRRQFAFSLFPALAAELIQAGRLQEARHKARLLGAELGENPYFSQLVERLAQGESMGAF